MLMKAKVIKSYPDKMTKKFYRKDTIIEFEEKRIEELINKGIVEPYKEVKSKSQEISD